MPAGIPRLDLFCVTAPADLPLEVYHPFVSLILQGEKVLHMGNETVCYRAGEFFMAAVDLPAAGKVTVASETAPYLAIRLTIDIAAVSELMCQLPATAMPAVQRGFAVGEAEEALIDAWLRLLRAGAKPDDKAIMVPLLEREVLYRLLSGAQGGVLRQIADHSRHFANVRKAITHLQTCYSDPFSATLLASLAGMSISAFHRRFKTSTGLSPLQYQKRLRLCAARKQLLIRQGNIAAVALEVGYQSLTQFTREYTRLFGEPPGRDSRTSVRRG
ncbi:AraC family transcriptional regulator [Pantoea eucrina]|uniref:AraC family transcriptional regulator n=2 Tax=Pantoea eucrina TaxID=472693 RepID=A0ABS1ZA22_9GAMM|nr:AraC family transcriptional regulator [Pantoea eucrina]QNH53169.1 AraC family transcriptional regulator [Acinetobacter venetianus]